MKNIFLCIVGALLLTATVGCRTNKPSTPVQTVESAVPYIKAGTIIACTAALQNVPDTEKKDIAQKIYAVSVVVDTLSTGTTPTPDQVRDVLLQFAPARTNWAEFVTSIKNIYEVNYNKYSTNQNVKIATLILQSISQGCKEASAPYVPTPTVVTPTNIIYFNQKCTSPIDLM